jgi:hypothetical protein
MIFTQKKEIVNNESIPFSGKIVGKIKSIKRLLKLWIKLNFMPFDTRSFLHSEIQPQIKVSTKSKE